MFSSLYLLLNLFSERGTSLHPEAGCLNESLVYLQSGTIWILENIVNEGNGGRPFQIKMLLRKVS